MTKGFKVWPTVPFFNSIDWRGPVMKPRGLVRNVFNLTFHDVVFRLLIGLIRKDWRIIFLFIKSSIRDKYKAYSCPRITRYERENNSNLDLHKKPKEREFTRKTFYNTKGFLFDFSSLPSTRRGDNLYRPTKAYKSWQ